MSDEGKLFVGGLSFDTTEDSLSSAFGKYGTIEKVDVIRDKETGRSRGFGFVKYNNTDDAKDALEGMNSKTLDGRVIRVDEAGKGGGRPRTGFNSAPRGRFGSSGRGRGGRGYSRDFGGGGYNGERGYGDRSSYSDRGFSGDRNFGGGGSSGGGGGYRSGGGSGGGYSSGGGGGGGYRENRNQGNYGDRTASYREAYDSYATHE